MSVTPDVDVVTPAAAVTEYRLGLALLEELCSHQVTWDLLSSQASGSVNEGSEPTSTIEAMGLKETTGSTQGSSKPSHTAPSPPRSLVPVSPQLPSLL